MQLICLRISSLTKCPSNLWTIVTFTDLFCLSNFPSCRILAWWHYTFPNINSLPASISRPAILLSRVQFWHLFVWLSLRWIHLSFARILIFKLASTDTSLCKSCREALGQRPSFGQIIFLYIVLKSLKFWKETNVMFWLPNFNMSDFSFANFHSYLII